MDMRSNGRGTAVALVALTLVACGGQGEDGEVAPTASSKSSPKEAAAPVQAGFGGVIEVTFSTDDAAAQDAAAIKCGLVSGSRAGLAAAPLPPSTRWYPDPTDPDAVLACLREQPLVLRALRPL